MNSPPGISIAWPAMEKIILRALRDAGVTVENLILVERDHDPEVGHAVLAGVRHARDRLLQYRLLGAQPAAILVIGWSTPDETDDEALLAVRAWPGLVFLTYGFSRDDLERAARSALIGRAAPLPHLGVSTQNEAIIQFGRIAHWLAGRESTLGMLREHIAQALNDGSVLPDGYLEANAFITPQRRYMIDYAVQLGASVARAGTQRATLDRFERGMFDLEARAEMLNTARRACRQSGVSGQPRLLAMMDAVRGELAGLHRAALDMQAALQPARQLS